MAKLRQAMQLALRERRRAVLLFGIWAIVTLVCAVAGPFGTINAFGLAGRLGYWGLVVGVSVLSSLLPFRAHGLARGLWLGVWATYTLALAIGIFALNILIFDRAWGLVEFAELLGQVAVIVIVVHAVFWLIDFAQPAAINPSPDPQTVFLRRLPVASRGALVRIEAQDHYLNVVTANGSALILMRLSDAAEELREAAGMSVHRSHWVALPAVRAHRREKGRDLLLMSDGTEVPVSRSNRARAQEAGLF